MKKFFTTMFALVAMAGTAFTAQAEDEAYFKCFVDGTEVKDGDRIDITKYLEIIEIPGWGLYRVYYDTKLTMTAEVVGDMVGVIDFVKNETPLTTDGLYGADFNARCCGLGTCYNAYLGKGPVKTDIYETSPGLINHNMETELELNSIAGDNDISIWQYGSAAPFQDLEIKAEFTMKLTLEDQEMNLTFFVDQKGVGAGIHDIDADSDAETIYFDLQGRRVEKPSNGLFIVKKGNKVAKQFVR